MPRMAALLHVDLEVSGRPVHKILAGNLRISRHKTIIPH